MAELYRNHSDQSSIIRANKAAVVAGFISAAGMSLVANFQETNVLSVHLTGALLSFGGATVYLWLQVMLYHPTKIITILVTIHEAPS